MVFDGSYREGPYFGVPTQRKDQTMNRLITAALFAAFAATGFSQTLFRITNVTVTEKETVRKGSDVTAEIRGAEGTDHVVVFTDQGVVVKARVKVSTANVRRSSIKDSAVNAIFEINMTVDGDKDNRRIEKIYYGEQTRTSHFKEKFTFKSGITVRVVTVEFDGSLE